MPDLGNTISDFWFCDVWFCDVWFLIFDFASYLVHPT